MSDSTLSLTVRQVRKNEGAELGDILIPILIQNPERFYLDHEAIKADPLKILYGSLKWLAYELSDSGSEQAGFFAFAPEHPTTPIGFIRMAVTTSGKEACLILLWAHEDYLVDEVAPTLFKEATAWAKSKGAKRLRTIIPVASELDLKFYQEQGFDEVINEPFDHRGKLAKTPIRLMTVGKKI